MPRHGTPLEVTWPGKFRSDGSRTPFTPGNQTVTAADIGGLASGDFLHCDCLDAAGWLIERFGGHVDLVYLDPPFNTGMDHRFLGKPKQARGDGTDGESVEPEGEVCYSDRFEDGEASYANFLWQRLMLARRLLATRGTIILHGPDREAPLMAALLDDVFGQAQRINAIIWHYTGGGRSRSRLSNKHDVLHWYANGEDWHFNQDAIREPYSPTSRYAKSGIRAKSGRRYEPHPDGTVPDDV